jgi:hypothetical protein
VLPLKSCLPTRAPSPRAGPDWPHDIKHDGFRIIAWCNGERVWRLELGRCSPTMVGRIDRGRRMGVPVESVAVGKCYVTEIGQLRRVLESKRQW